MGKYNTIYYLLFVLIIMGAFASMALNAYGMKLIGYSCLGFSLTFLHEAIFGVRKREDLTSHGKIFLTTELIILALLSCLFFLRSLLITFPFAEGVFITSIVLLIGTYLYISIQDVRRLSPLSNKAALGILVYYLSLILFTFTMILSIVSPLPGTIMAILGFIFLACYIAMGIMFGKMIIEGEEYTLYGYTLNLKNKTTVVYVAIIMIFTFYLFRDADLIPAMYTGDTPTGYIRLIQEAESSVENQDKMTEKYLLFKDRYDQFIEKYD